ncbi:MAG: hypothetical protein IIV45_00630 [Lachnospiraceae bacterium]|nr:hypothetical protein [Lachnospiraceae bacterium]
MTDEEMAVEYCNNEVPFDITESGEKLYTETDLKQAFLAGLKAGKDMAEADLATVAYMQGASRNKAKLDEAKEIIREYLGWADWEGSNCPSFESICRKAESFLKECV